MVEDNLIEGSLKYRDGRKWKQRWGVLNKLSPVADVLQLQLYRDSRDRARGASTKASLALTSTLALITGFTLDKESHTVAILCRELTLILAFDSRERLLQWTAKLNIHLGHEQQFLIQLVKVPLKSRIPVGPSKLHVRDHRFCITAGTPPRIIAAWASADVRRYGVIDGRFVWEGGTRCGRGAGVHVALSDVPHDITRSFDMAARGSLTSSHRRTKSPDPCGTVQRDAATWLREVRALDLSKLSDAASLAPSDGCNILSPHGVFLSRSDISSGTWNRRPSCTAHESYITGGSSSSSGSLIGEEPGWWANTWATGRGSMWEVAPDTLYDSPKPFLHQTVSSGYPSIVGIQHWCSSSTLKSTQTSVCNSAYHKPCVTTNPLDNYDVPKSQLYDVPRKFHHVTDSDVKGVDKYGCIFPGRTDTCGRVMGWAEALMCRRSETADNMEPVRVNGEGRMPVLDANTGTIIQPNIRCNCECGTLPRYSKVSMCSEKSLPEFNISNKTAIYAVVDKSKKTTRPSCPPNTLKEDSLVSSNPNYANVNSSVNVNPSQIATEPNTQCSKCGGDVEEKPPNDQSKEDSTVSSDQKKKEIHYIVMGPASSTDPVPPQYLFMDEVTEKSPLKSSRKTPYRPGRSLSLARRNRSPSPSNRRSTSADSRLNEPWDWSQYETPEPTPGGTPVQSPPQSPFKCSRASNEPRGRGRSRQKALDQCSNSSATSSACGVVKPLEVPPCELKFFDSPVLRRSSSVPGQKYVNRDSASSSDSGVYESPKHSERFILSHCYHNSLPRGHAKQKYFSRELSDNYRKFLQGEKVDGKSSSSGNSDTSDYLDTLSLSSYSSSEYERLFGRASVTTLRPRFGKEYSRLDRATLDTNGKIGVTKSPT